MKPIKTLLITGENNHDWRRTAPHFKKTLEDSSLFSVDMTENPNESLSKVEVVNSYDLIVLDYNGEPWTDVAKENFESAISQGTGLAIIHASNNSFDGWIAYEKMLGLGFRDGSAHGNFHQFEVEIVDHEHPITKSMSNFYTTDELYHRLVPMHGVPYQTLATAYSAEEQGGTGAIEPMMIVLQYGTGRIFHLALGHVWPFTPEWVGYEGSNMTAVESEGFKTSLLRGCVWAATGDVRI